MGIFNAVVIPLAAILTARFYGVRDGDGGRRRVAAMEPSRPALLQDGFFLIDAELLLIVLLQDRVLAAGGGAALLAVYVAYFVVLARGLGGGESGDTVVDHARDPKYSWAEAILRLNHRRLLFGSRPLTNRRAWVLLAVAGVTVAAACWGLAEAVVMSADALGVAAFYTALILAAGATSIPDTVLSIKDTVAGAYDDAVAKAFGSNTFDITVALGGPLFVYGLLYGAVPISADAGVAAHVADLRIILLAFTVAVLTLFLAGRFITPAKGGVLAGLYVGWIGYVTTLPH